MHTLYGISFCETVCPVSDQRQMLLAAAAGFEVTELVLGKEGFKDRLHAAREGGLSLAFVRLLPDYVNAIWGEKELWSGFYAYFKERLAEARTHGFDSIVLLASQGVHPPAISQRGLDNLRLLSSEAEAAGMHILLENGESAEHFEIAVRMICRGFHGVAFRPSVFARAAKTSAVPRYALPHVKAIILDDILRDNDGYIPYDGETDYDAFADSLAKISYRGVFLARVNPCRGGYVDMRYEELASAVYESLLKLSRICYKKEGIIP